MNWYFIRICFSLILVFTYLYAEETDIRKLIDEMPKMDREDLEFVFSELVRDHFAYTLFGDKPISLSGHFVVIPWENVIEHVSPSDAIFWKKWKTWEKYQHQFKFKNYLMIKENRKSKLYKITTIYLINKNEFIRTIKRHSLLFESVLGHKIIPEQMLNDIEYRKISFSETIQNNEMLLGILLGYGKHNSSLYSKKERDYFNSPLLSMTALEHSTIKLEACGDYGFYPFLINSVYFSGDLSHPETKFLQKKYRQQRSKISGIYNYGDFLEITLSKLIS